MKTIVSVLLLSAVALGAQIPSPPNITNNPAFQRALREATNAPATTGPATPSRTLPTIPAAPARNQPGAQPPTVPSVPAAQVPDAQIPIAPPPQTTPPEQFVDPGIINFTSADINQVLQIYAGLVNRTILRPATLPQVSIVLQAQTPLTVTEAKQALEAVIALNGVELVPFGEKFVKAVPSAQAGNIGAAIGTNGASSLPELGSYVTHVARLEYLTPSEVVPVLTPFASVGMAPPVALDDSRVIILRDHAENVKRMLEMIERIDVTVPDYFISEVIPIKFAKAEDIANALNSLSSGGGGTTVGGSTGRSVGRTTTPMQGGRPGQPGYNPMNPQQTITPGGASTGTPSSGGSFSDRLRNIIQRASASGDLTIIGQTKIIADIRSNSLLVFATREDMKMIKDIIEKLDVVLAQVLIETIILDVSLDDTWALGVSAGQHPRRSGNFTGGGVYNNPSGSSPLSTLDQFFGTAATNLSGSFPSSSGLSYFGRFNQDFDVAVQAAASDSRINVIQKPRIQTSHATPAQIFVGSTVPYVSSVYYGGGYAGGPSSSFQQLQVGIGLTVTPYINQDGLVVMQIDQTIDEISGSTDITGVGSVPNTTHRTLSAEVAVRDRDTIVLGGFIRNSDSKNRSGIPILKDIPLLGALFSSRGSTKERKELMVLMRPTVLKTPELAAAYVQEEKKLMPGVRRAEEEHRREIEKEAARHPFKEVTPFTPEEKRLFSTPPPETP